MSISLAYELGFTITDTDTGFGISSGNPDRTINGLNDRGTLTPSTSVPVSKYSCYELTLSSGSGSINLAALPGRTADETVVGTGLKVQLLVLKNKSSNANKITVAKGGSNGYSLNSAEDAWTETLDPGDYCIRKLNDTAPDVASGKRIFDVTGTGSQILQVLVGLG